MNTSSDGGISSGMMKKRKIAGFLAQVRIISWKNLMLYKKNRSGIACEIIFSCLFTLVFVLLVYFARPDYMSPKIDTYHLPIIKRGTIPSNPDLSNITRMFYYPANPFVESLAREALDVLTANSLIPLNVNLTSTNVTNGADLDDDDKKSLLAMIVFSPNLTSAADSPDNIEYFIYTKETSQYSSYKTGQMTRPEEEYMYSQSPEASCQSDANAQKYDFFNAIKYTVDLSLIHKLTNKQLDPDNIILMKYSCPDYLNDLLKTYLSFFTPVLISLSFLVTFLVTISSIIREKESKMKEYLRLIGVNPVVIWLCWMMRSFIIYLLISCIATITSTVKIDMDGTNPISNQKALFLSTDPFLILLMFLAYSIQVTSLSLLTGQIFSKPFIAKTVGIIFWFVTFFNYYNTFAAASKYFFCIFPNTALTFATQVIFQFERSNKKFDMSRLFSNLFDDGLTLGGILIAMLAWSAVYLVLSWYIERIFPGEYGVKMPWYFPFMPSYWFEKVNSDEERMQLNSIINDEDSDAFEPDPTGLYASVKIEKLSKKFRVGFEEKTVVNNISLNFYENQITGFLGHNGAGKTTVTFMLCGMYTPSSGTAYIHGHDIRTHMSRIRSSIGFCPQNNILYDELSVRQHLDLVASIKGFSKKEIDLEIARIASFVGLQGDLNKKSCELSGGMKRRLSVAMALIGDSKVIILDEPTSGLDPYNRRSLWELIRNYKQGRTIILTTHYMEEADALSDRIALMNHGQVKCCGSPLFLKDRFGSGYRLTLSKDVSFNQFALENLVERVTARPVLIESNIAREMCIGIPTQLSSCLPELLTYIEENRKSLGILNYGISSSTVEEVFLKIGSIDVNDNIFSKTNNKKSNQQQQQKRKMSDQPTVVELNKYDNLSSAFTNDPDQKNTSFALIRQQLIWLCFKRARILGRRYVIAISTLLLPVVLEAVLSAIIPSSAVVISDAINSFFGIRTIPPLELDPYKYGQQNMLINTNNSQLYANFSAYLDRQAIVRGKPRSNIRVLPTEGVPVDSYVYAERKSDIRNIIGKYYFGLEMNVDSSRDELVAEGYFSTFPYHTSASLLNQIDSFMLAYHSNNPNRSITTVNAPVSITLVQNFTNINPNDLNFFTCIEGIPFSYLDIINGIIVAFVIACTTITLIRERTSGSKSLQLLSGTHYMTYWASNLIFDMFVYVFTIGTMILALKIVALARSSDSTNDTVIVASKGATLAYYLLFLLLVSLSWAVLAYVASFLFKSDVIGFVVVFLVLGFACLFDMICGYLKLLDAGLTGGKVGTLGHITDTIRYVFAFLFPNVAVKRALFNLKIQNMPVCITLLDLAFQSNMKNVSGFAYPDPGIGKFVILNYINLLGGIILLFLLETKLISRTFQSFFYRTKVDPTSVLNLESDVRDESNRIKSSSLRQLALEEPVLIRDLCRVFKKNGRPFMAVNNLSFGVRPAECFGLLGLNGAGKTTTIQVLTGQIESSSGAAFVNGFNINAERLEAIRSLGYCPQFDYLPEYLTVRESLELYACLRGLKRNVIKDIIDDFISAFKLNEFQTKLVQNLSGGNKRKVSSAISFIGKPKTVILDEPTSGMDPAARRYLWNVIKHARDCGMTIVLTTHSMEESEALCTNLGIMVNGQFECFGNIQHLKHKYGKGYSLIIKCKTDLDQVANNQSMYYVNYAEEFVQTNIPNALLKDKQQQTLFYQIIVDEPDDDFNKKEDNKINVASAATANASGGLSIAKIFRLIESNKDALNIETYSLSQTTLEQVFLSFARKQFDPNEHTPPSTSSRNSSLTTRYAANRVGNNGDTDQLGRFNPAYDNNDQATVIIKELNV